MGDDDITFSVSAIRDSENCGGRRTEKMETVKITRMRTLYKKLREGVKLKADNAKELGTKPAWWAGGKENMVNKKKKAISSQSRSANTDLILTRGR
jgi:hypothetical protein